MLVEAAWAAARAPGPLRAFFLRVRARRGQHVAAVATARKLAVIIWHLLSKGESYAWARPALHARKLRDLELKAGYKAERGPKRRSARLQYQEPSRSGAAGGSSKPRRPTRASWPVGILAGPNRRARAPQTRCDDEGCAAGLAPRASRPALRRAVTRAREKNSSDLARKHLSITSVWFSRPWPALRCSMIRRSSTRRAPGFKPVSTTKSPRFIGM